MSTIIMNTINPDTMEDQKTSLKMDTYEQEQFRSSIAGALRGSMETLLIGGTLVAVKRNTEFYDGKILVRTLGTADNDTKRRLRFIIDDKQAREIIRQ